MVLDPWMRNPTLLEILDTFDDSSISTYKWTTPVIVGGTSITEAGGVLNIKNVGGAAGLSYLPSRYAEYGKHSRISVDLALVTGSVIGAGNHAEASLVLYKNANNWIRYGPYRDFGSSINNRAYLRIMQGGVLTVTAVDISICDTDIRTFTISQTGLDVVFYLNGIRATSFEWPEFIGFQAFLEAGTTGAGQHIEVHFDDFEVQDSYDPIFVTLGGLIRYIYDQFPDGVAASVWDELKASHTAPNTFGDYLDTKLSTLSVNVAAAWDALKVDHVIPGSFGDYLDEKISAISVGGDTFTAVSGTLSLPSITAVALEFLAATYGTVFRPVVSFNIVGPTLDYCYLYSSASYTDYLLAANNLSSGDVPLVAASGAAANDVIIFGRSALHHRLNCVVSNGPFNSDSVFDWVYWDGAAWQLLAGVTDGTRRELVSQSCDAITHWQDASGGKVTVSLDNADYVVGTGSIKAISAGGLGAGQQFVFQCVGFPAQDWSSYTFLDFWCKSSIGISAGQFQLEIYNGTPTSLGVIPFPALSANVWTHVHLSLPTPLNYFSVVNMNFEETTDLGAFTMRIDDMRVVTREFSQDGAVTWTTNVTSQTLNGHASYYVGARIKSLGSSRPVGSYFSIATDAETDFDARAVFGTYLYMEVYRKISGAYPLRPDDVMIFQQANLRKNPSVDVLCYSDTKLVFTLSSTPTASISVPYQGTIETLKV